MSKARLTRVTRVSLKGIEREFQFSSAWPGISKIVQRTVNLSIAHSRIPRNIPACVGVPGGQETYNKAGFKCILSTMDKPLIEAAVDCVLSRWWTTLSVDGWIFVDSSFKTTGVCKHQYVARFHQRPAQETVSNDCWRTPFCHLIHKVVALTLNVNSTSMYRFHLIVYGIWSPFSCQAVNLRVRHSCSLSESISFFLWQRKPFPLEKWPDSKNFCIDLFILYVFQITDLENFIFDASI